MLRSQVKLIGTFLVLTTGTTSNKISKTTAIEWRDRLLSEAELVFTPAHEQQKICQKLKSEIESLHTVLGEMAAENSFFKKKLLS